MTTRTQEQLETKRVYDRERRATRTPEQIEAKRAYQREYDSSSRGKAATLRYNASPEARVAKRKWATSPEGREKCKEAQRARRTAHKTMAHKYLGGVCVECGTTERLEFDHIDSTTKVFNISSYLMLSPERLRLELDKCQLLCKPCHMVKTTEERRAA